MDGERPSATHQTVLPMVKGDGEDSYSKNSQYQAFLAKVPMLALDGALEKLTLPSGSGPVCIADLGCSSGPNTIAVVDHIIAKLRTGVPKDTEFQAYFNDVPSNDFNNLFQLLSSDSRARNFYAAGAPGSFYGRVFPPSSIHVFHSGMALPWMSKISDAILDKKSPAYNKGKVWYQHSKSAVARCYQEQALLDLKNFFVARAAELVSGGLLFLYSNGRETSEPNENDGDMVYNFQLDLDEILSGLVAEGLVTEEQLDSFNIPLYHRSADDVREALTCCGSMFNLERMEMHRGDFKKAFAAEDATVLPARLKDTFKAIFNPLLEGHFGMNVADVIWKRHEKLVKNRIGSRPEFLKLWVVVLTRN
ncbi:unnamed protein product [Calypogeia fissa]